MTALDEVLKAEQEAEKMIETAEAEAVSAVANARNEHDARMQSEVNRLKEEEVLALNEYKKQVDDQASKIEAETADKVVAVQKKFSSKKEDLLVEVKKNFQ